MNTINMTDVENQMVVPSLGLGQHSPEVDPDFAEAALNFAKARAAAASDAELDMHVDILDALNDAPQPVIDYIRDIQRARLVAFMVRDL
jgi:hypothetical protein